LTIKLLIVDDSALMRRHLTTIFTTQGDFTIQTARNGQEAVEQNQLFLPDVITLDINMPEMDGLTALALINATRPVPVVMFSSLTEKSALATFEALALGAIDYLAKPEGTISISIEAVENEIVRKVRAAAGARIKPRAAKLLEKVALPRKECGPERHAHSALRSGNETAMEGLVIIGVSTGGPGTLEEILPLLPGDYPFPVIVAQHMPRTFTGPFANRLNKMCALQVCEVDRPLPLMPGHIYIARGGADSLIAQRGGVLTVFSRPESSQHLWHPSVELLGRSVLEHCRAEHVIAVMLTGMGNDGAEAFAEIKKQGGRTIAEAQETAVVFGMPKELIDRSGATLTLPADKIATQLIGWSRS
jgi:two-component system chemotaxis response regulator CheB